MSPPRLLPSLVTLALLAAACTTPTQTEPTGSPGSGVPVGASALPSFAIDARPGPFQITVDGADVPAGSVLDATDAEGRSLGRVALAENGTALWRDLPPGPVHLYQLDGGRRVAEAPLLIVPGDEPPPADSYATTALEEGFGYIPTRDGTALSAYVTLPGPAADGPYPTLVEYSGYAPSRPDDTDPGRLLVPALGYALVQVNVRGTGCSGGSFDAFEPIERFDGYDVIETVAAQPWAAKVGMYGVSYAGIMQLVVAATRPPSLAAIAPLSVLDRIGSVLQPGGIYNDGFAQIWIEQVSDGASAYGQGWEQGRVDGGDTVCETNQKLRVHNPDLMAQARTSSAGAELLADRSPLGLASSIEVPVFLAGAWQDEQTGGTWPNLIPALVGAPVVRAVGYNGLHADSISPDLLAEVTEFYDLYLDDPEPGAPPLAALVLSVGLSRLYGSVVDIPFNRFDPTERPALRQRYEDEEPIEVRFEQGAPAANLPVAAFTARFRSWPPPEMVATSFGLHPDATGGLTLTGEPAPTSSSTVDPAAPTPGPESAGLSFTTVPSEGRLTTSSDPTRITTADPGWEWPRRQPGHAIVATSDPAEDDLVLVGPARAELWVSADSPDGDVEVTVSEISPDGAETYVQSGWLRLSQRASGPPPAGLGAVDAEPVRQSAPLTPGGPPVLAQVEIPPLAHVIRAGSRVRITIDTPGASRPRWRFAVAGDPVTITVHAGPDTPSRLVLPVVPDVAVPTPRPGCGTLRAQPCRP